MGKHLLYYVSLISLLFIGFGLARYLAAYKQAQMGIIVLTAFLYALWGIVHHMIHHSFSIKIMLEYIAIATLAISIIYFVLNIAL